MYVKQGIKKDFIMNVFVSSKKDVEDIIKRHNADALLSLNDIGKTTIQNIIPKHNHLQMEMEDAYQCTEFGAPTKEQVGIAICWARGWRGNTLVVNCGYGVSRSTAMAAAILADNFGVDEAIKKLLIIRPQACPNPLVSKFADEFLNFNGDLFNACEKIAKKTHGLLIGMRND